jgi:hypothetical protein
LIALLLGLAGHADAASENGAGSDRLRMVSTVKNRLPALDSQPDQTPAHSENDHAHFKPKD